MAERAAAATEDDLAEFAFNIFDADGTGKIAAPQFKLLLKKSNSGASLGDDELDRLVGEAGKGQQDGAITFDGFKRMVHSDKQDQLHVVKKAAKSMDRSFARLQRGNSAFFPFHKVSSGEGGDGSCESPVSAVEVKVEA